MSKSNIGVIGFGEVGTVLTRQFHETEHQVWVADPLLSGPTISPFMAAKLEALPVKTAGSIAALVEAVDLMVSTVTVRVSEQVAREAAGSWRQGLFVDFNSTSPLLKQRLAGGFPDDSYVDGAILGPIAGKGPKTPLALAGTRADEAESILSNAGFVCTVISQEVGGASSLKICRSIFMKGIECLFLETLLAAGHFHLEQAVLDTIEDTFTSYGLKPMAEMLLTSHAVHCQRRGREMEGAVEMLKELDLPYAMSAASGELLAASHKAGLPQHYKHVTPDSSDDVLQRLSRFYREHNHETSQ